MRPRHRRRAAVLTIAVLTGILVPLGALGSGPDATAGPAPGAASTSASSARANGAPVPVTDEVVALLTASAADPYAAEALGTLLGQAGQLGTAESLTTRRRAPAAQVAAGVPRTVLNRALLMETAVPLAPALLLAGAGGLVIGAWYSALGSDGSLPWAAPLVAPAVYASCLLVAAATALPLLGRSVRPGELRYA